MSERAEQPGLGGVRKGRWVGAPIGRLEDERVLSGEARYVADIQMPNTAHLAFVRSAYAHAEITAIDTEEAMIDGVISILTARDFSVLPLEDAMPKPDLPKTPQEPIVAERVRWVGEAVAVVVADSPYVAEEAAQRVMVDYEPLTVVEDVETALSPDAPVIHEHLGSNVLYREKRTFGDVDAAFAAADTVVKRQLSLNRVSASPMETRGCLATYERSSEQLTLWSSSPAPELLRTTLAHVLSHPHSRLRVIAPDVGGAFGAKMPTYPEEVLVAYLARELRRPVRWIEDRRESLMTLNHGKEQHIDLEIAAKADGRIVAMRAKCVGDAGAYSFNSATALIEPALTANLMPSVYDVRAYEYEMLSVITNKTPIGPYRGVGWTAGHTTREILLDELAVTLGIDKSELREKNLVREFPYLSISGCAYDSGSYRESLRSGLEGIGYHEIKRQQATWRTEGKYVGVGISPYVEPTGYGTKIGHQTGYPYPTHDNATVTVDAGGKVRVAVGISSQGQGHRTTFAQVAADALGVVPEDVEVIAGDTDRVPFGMGAWGSRGAVIGGGAIALAAGDVRAKVLEIAGNLLEAAPEDLTFDDGEIAVKGSPSSAVTLATVASAAYFDPDVRPEDGDPFLSATRFYDPEPTYSNGCYAARAEVDGETGIVRVTDVFAVEDCGTVINPAVVDGQIRGGVVQALGLALLEDLVYDGEGQLVTTTFMDYLLPLASDAPRIEIKHLETPSTVTVAGIKGMGESSLIAAPGAIVTAVLDAIGEYDPALVELPLTPERVLRLTGRLSPA